MEAIVWIFWRGRAILYQFSTQIEGHIREDSTVAAAAAAEDAHPLEAAGRGWGGGVIGGGIVGGDIQEGRLIKQLLLLGLAHIVSLRTSRARTCHCRNQRTSRHNRNLLKAQAAAPRS